MMARPIRIAQSLATLNRGGAETVVMEWLRNIDRERFQFDFIVNQSDEPYDFEEEAIALGARIFRVPAYRLSNVLSYAHAWSRLLKEHPEWGIIHAHNTTPAAVFLTIARLRGRVAIAHGHSAGVATGVKISLKQVLTWPLRYIADHRLACSRKAGEWWFGRHRTFCVVPNAVDVDRFEFDAQSRNASRAKLGLGGELLIGHVGSFREEKNHFRLIEIFAELLLERENARLVLVGEGDLRPEVELQVSQLGLTDKVIFTGVRGDTPDLFSAMDVFVLPSISEGLGVVLVEAQASGLTSVASTAVPDEVAFSRLVDFVSLESSNAEWVRAILAEGSDPESTSPDRHIGAKIVREAGYDVRGAVAKLQERYAALVQEFVPQETRVREEP